MSRFIYKVEHICPNCEEITNIVGPSYRCHHCGYKLKEFDEEDSWYDDRD